MKKPTSDRSGEAALVYSDYLLDHDDERGSNHWRLVGLIQTSLDTMYHEQAKSSYRMAMRRYFNLVVGGRTFSLTCTFRRGNFVILLIEKSGGNYRLASSTRVRWYTAQKDSQKAFRNAALRLSLLVF